MKTDVQWITFAENTVIWIVVREVKSSRLQENADLLRASVIEQPK